MDLLFILLSAGFILLGIAGSFLPVIPGPISGWLGIFLLSFAPSITLENSFLLLSLGVALSIFILDNIIPILGAKKFGGGKGSTLGSSIGLIVGLLFLGPIGLLLGPFFGAFIGELISNINNKKGALKAAFGALLGFFTGVFLKLIIGMAFAFTYVKILWNTPLELL